jgi:hypothetical protein
MSALLQVHARGYEPRTIKFTVSQKSREKRLTPTWLDVNLSPVVRQATVVSDQVLLLTNPPDEASTLHHTGTQKTMVGMNSGHTLSPFPFTEITPTSMDLVQLSNTLEAERCNEQEQLPFVKAMGSGGISWTSMKYVVVLSVTFVFV